MQYLVSAEEMRKADNHTIETIGIPAMVLMERAALAALECVERHVAATLTEGKIVGGGAGNSVLILAGMGNNGGDGLALARLLSERGFYVEVCCVGDEEKASGQWIQQRNILEHYAVTLSAKPQREEYTVLVDALFGVGLSRDVAGEYARAIEGFNGLRGFKLALDLPSGIDSDTGRLCGCAVCADETVTFGFCKRGLVLFPGCEYAGRVEVADIGISSRSFITPPEMFTLKAPVDSLIQKRRADGNKGTFGKILLVAGSVNMAGAAILAARAAYRTGAGMVKVISPEENRIILQSALPEALFGMEVQLENSMEWADVIAVGPGLGTDERARTLFETVLYHSKKPLVIDADALNILAKEEEFRGELGRQAHAGRKLLLTPHVGELARLVGKTVADCVSDSRYGIGEIAKGLSEELGCVVVAKDARTYVCKTGNPMYLNSNGNSGMATAGSGDVLTGISAALLAGETDVFRAAVTAVYLHGAAGDAAAREKGLFACMAGDIAECIARVLH